MTDINLQTITPDTTLPTTGFLFGADSQASGSPSVYTVQSVATTLLGSTTLSGATITADAPVLNLAQTWNNAAITFTGLKLNATDTASAAASLLMDLQVGGTSRFNVRKDGQIVTQGGMSAQGALLTTSYLQADAAAGVWLRNAAGELAFGNPSDLKLTRRDPANLRFGAADAAAPVAQKLSVQSVVAGTTNTAGANLTITGSQGTGTGAGGSIIFQVALAGSSGTAQNALVTALTIASTTDATFANAVSAGATSYIAFSSRSRLYSPADSIILLSNNGVSNFDRLQFGGTTSSFPAIKRSSASLIVRLADDTANAALESASLKTDAPTGGTAATWKLGTVATVSPTSPNRTIEVDIGGTIYYISAKTTND